MKKSLTTVVTLLLLNQLTSSCFATGSGATSNVTGTTTKLMGTGYAGSALADSPEMLWFNPAGLPHVKGFQTTLGASLLNFDIKHTANTNTEAASSGQEDKLVKHWPVAPFFYATYSSENSPFAYGLGINSPYGLITAWKDDSFSKYYATESKLLMYAVNPTIAYQVNEKFSLAGGLDYFNLFDAELNSRVSPLAFGTGDGRSKLSGNGHAWGYNAAVHFKANEQHSFGLSYRSQINVPLKGDVELTGLSGATAVNFGGPSFKTDVATEFKFPQNVLLGYAFRPNEKWTIVADYEWDNWNVYQETRFDYGQNPGSAFPTSIGRHWMNTNNIGLGATWKAKQWWDLRLGAFAYERVVPKSDVESSLPDSSRWGPTIGSGFHFGSTTIDFGYNPIFFNKQTVSNNHQATNPLTSNLLYSQNGTFDVKDQVISLAFTQKWGGTN